MLAEGEHPTRYHVGIHKGLGLGRALCATIARTEHARDRDALLQGRCVGRNVLQSVKRLVELRFAGIADRKVTRVLRVGPQPSDVVVGWSSQGAALALPRNASSSRHCSGVTSEANTQLSESPGCAGAIRAKRKGLPDSKTSQPSSSKNARATGRSPGAYIAATWCSIFVAVVGIGVVVMPAMLEVQRTP